MRIAINQVKEGNAQAAVSAGNTGALMATARFVLKTIPGIERPAIAKFLPSDSEHVTLALDLGANVDCTPEQLVQFAIIGSELVHALHPEKGSPRVALLNVGTEDIKGTDAVKQTFKLLSSSKLKLHRQYRKQQRFVWRSRCRCRRRFCWQRYAQNHRRRG